jgi:hypothetical protein
VGTPNSGIDLPAAPPSAGSGEMGAGPQTQLG